VREHESLQFIRPGLHSRFHRHLSASYSTALRSALRHDCCARHDIDGSGAVAGSRYCSFRSQGFRHDEFDQSCSGTRWRCALVRCASASACRAFSSSIAVVGLRGFIFSKRLRTRPNDMLPRTAAGRLGWYRRLLPGVAELGSLADFELDMNLKRPCLLALCSSLGMVAVGIALWVILDHVIPDHAYNGMIWFILLMVLILLGAVCSVISLIWCIGCSITAICRYVHTHRMKHPDSHDAT